MSSNSSSAAVRMPSKRPSPAELAQAYTQEGLSLRKCAARFGISPVTAAQMLRDAGETIRPPGAAPAQVDRAALARAYRQEGWSLSQCGVTFGISATTAARIIRDAGVTVRPARRPAARVDPIKLARAYQARSLNQCGTAFGITARTAARILRDAGVTIRSGRDLQPNVDPDELAQAYQEWGWSIRKCAAEFGISTAVVSRTLREANVLRRPAGPRPAAIDPAELARAYQHQGLASCADQFATSVHTIRRLLQAQGVPIRPASTRVGRGGAEAQQSLPTAGSGEAGQRAGGAAGQDLRVRKAIGDVAAA